MYKLNKDLVPGMVVWAKRAPFYDKPYLVSENDKAMYVVTRVNDTDFFGCPLVRENSCLKNTTILLKKDYPIDFNSRINECIYKIDKDDIINSDTFNLTKGAFRYFRRSMYKRIVLDHAEGPKEYNDLFADEYMRDYVPSKYNIIVYPTAMKIFDYYLITDYDDHNFELAPASCVSRDKFEVDTDTIITRDRKERFFDYFEHPIVFKKKK